MVVRKFDEQKKDVFMNDVVRKQAGYFGNMTTKKDIERGLMVLEKLRDRLNTSDLKQFIHLIVYCASHLRGKYQVVKYY